MFAVGTDSAAVPSVPPVSDECHERGRDTCESEQKGSWCVGIGGELLLAIGPIEEDHVGVGMSCARAMSVELVELTNRRKHALLHSLVSHGAQRPCQACTAKVRVAHIEVV